MGSIGAEAVFLASCAEDAESSDGALERGLVVVIDLAATAATCDEIIGAFLEAGRSSPDPPLRGGCLQDGCRSSHVRPADSRVERRVGEASRPVGPCVCAKCGEICADCGGDDSYGDESYADGHCNSSDSGDGKGGYNDGGNYKGGMGDYKCDSKGFGEGDYSRGGRSDGGKGYSDDCSLKDSGGESLVEADRLAACGAGRGGVAGGSIGSCVRHACEGSGSMDSMGGTGGMSAMCDMRGIRRNMRDIAGGDGDGTSEPLRVDGLQLVHAENASIAHSRLLGKFSRTISRAIDSMHFEVIYLQG